MSKPSSSDMRTTISAVQRRVSRFGRPRLSGPQWILLTVIVLVVLGTYSPLRNVLTNEQLNPPEAGAKRQQLKAEYAQIAPFPGATPAHAVEEFNKTYSSLVSQVFNTTASYVQLRQFYDAELARHGWVFASDSGLGGRLTYYCKGDLEADLQYEGSGPHGEWDYSLDLSWGLYTRCPEATLQ